MLNFEFHAVTTERWPDLESFFEANGNPNYCWCMRWRLSSSQFSKEDAAGRKRRLEKLVNENIPIGVLAYHEGRVVGWCSIAPRESYLGLERSRVLKRIDEQPVWSVACFFVDRQFRGQGVTAKLLKAAVAYAGAQGAECVEGYPVEFGKSYQFMGAPSSYATVGFQEVGVASNGRKIVRMRTDQE
jgi:GNAT superfamily N-acetyltransferase